MLSIHARCSRVPCKQADELISITEVFMALQAAYGKGPSDLQASRHSRIWVTWGTSWTGRRLPPLQLECCPVRYKPQQEQPDCQRAMPTPSLQTLWCALPQVLQPVPCQCCASCHIEALRVLLLPPLDFRTQRKQQCSDDDLVGLHTACWLVPPCH